MPAVGDALGRPYMPCDSSDVLFHGLAAMSPHRALEHCLCKSVSLRETRGRDATHIPPRPHIRTCLATLCDQVPHVPPLAPGNLTQ